METPQKQEPVEEKAAEQKPVAEQEKKAEPVNPMTAMPGMGMMNPMMMMPDMTQMTGNPGGAAFTPEQQRQFLQIQAAMYQQMANYHQMLLQSFQQP